MLYRTLNKVEDQLLAVLRTVNGDFCWLEIGGHTQKHSYHYFNSEIMDQFLASEKFFFLK